MTITESQAKGLKTRFFNEACREIDLAFHSFKKVPLKNNIHGWNKYVSRFKKAFRRTYLVLYEGGSRKKPYLASCSFYINPENKYNSWKEQCLSATSFFMDTNHAFNEHPCMFNIGEHAISRLFQRAEFTVDEDGLPVTFSILPELKLIPLWAAYWTFLCFRMREDFLEIYPVIPAKSGLFFAEINVDTHNLEIRTFVSDSQLNERQLLTKKLMVEASDGLENSPLPFSPALEYHGYDDSYMQQRIMSFRLAKDLELIVGGVCSRSNDNNLRLKSKDFLKKYLLNECSGITEGMSNGYKGSNIRLIHNKIHEFDITGRMP
jgi:hypothetical protein